MNSRRSGGRDERRRRVLMDEPNATGSQAGESEASAGETPARGRSAPEYAEAAKAVRQVRLSDLVPRKAWLVTLLASLLLAGASAVVALAWYAPSWAWLDESSLALLAADDKGTLASWFASMLLLLSAAGAMQIYLLRRHKVNDYRGRYRLWVPVAVLFFLASADAVIGAHHLLATAARAIVPAAWNTSPQLAWMLPVSLLVAAVAIRLAVEVRRSYSTLLALITTSICYLLSAAIYWRPQLIPLAEGSPEHATATMVLAAQLAGHTMLAVTVMLYGRYVFLAANGLQSVRKPRVRRETKPKQKPAAAKSKSVDQPSESSSRRRKAKPARTRQTAKESPVKATDDQDSAGKESPPASGSKSKPAQAEESPPETIPLNELAQKEDLTEADMAHLSKAERRRLRKIKKRTDRAA